MCKLSQSIAQHVMHVTGHRVKYSSYNNSAADCSIALKFGTEFDYGIAGTYKCSRSKGKGQGHVVKVQGHIVT